MGHVSLKTGNACYHSVQNHSALILPRTASI